MDIVDRIDELVAESLNTPEDRRSGYDNNINQARCPRCKRHWHGLPITQRIADMYAIGRYDPEWTPAEDDSPIICEGSDFIGPRRPPPTPSVARPGGTFTLTFDGLRTRQEVYVSSGPSYRGFGVGMMRAAEVLHTWPLITDSFDLRSWVFDTSAWTHVIAGLTSDRLPAHHPIGRRPPWNYRAGITWGPRMWILEFRRRGRIPLTNTYPYRARLAGYDIPYPLAVAMCNAWPQFTTPEHQPPRPGYDFTALSDRINAMPDWASPTAWTPTTRPATAAAGRRARRTQPRGNR